MGTEAPVCQKTCTVFYPYIRIRQKAKKGITIHVKRLYVNRDTTPANSKLVFIFEDTDITKNLSKNSMDLKSS
jgi:uncharacterized protein affecting Mg2+/Co2+ transport